MFSPSRRHSMYLILGVAALLATSMLFSSSAFADTASSRQPVTTQPTASSDQVETVAMHRLYNPKSKEHLYTSDVNEKRVLTQQKGWRYEGVAWYSPAKSNTPVYRLYNKRAAAHHYTTDIKERDTLRSKGWRYEGIGWYSDDAKTIPVYRVYNRKLPLVANHHFTTDTSERTALLTKKTNRWRSEGIGWYAAAEGKKLRDGWRKINNKWTYWLEGTQVKNQWVITKQKPVKESDNGLQRYRIDEDGNAITGFFQLGSSDYYGIPSKIHVVRYAYKFDATHALVADNAGRLCQAKGWVVTNKLSAGSDLQRFYFEPTTKNKNYTGARIGFFNKDGHKYYGYKDKGYVARSSDNLLLEGQYFKANHSGHLSTDSIVGKMYKKAQGYSSKSRYLLMVDIDDCYTVVFQGRKGAWKIKYVWRCCTGRPATPTPIGTFQILWKVSHFGESHGYSCYYWSGFTTMGENYGFHSRIYYPYTHSPRYFKDGRLGERVSRGCVRLADENCIWIQKNCPQGTTVVCTK